MYYVFLISNYGSELMEKGYNKGAKFNIVLGPVLNLSRMILPDSFAERGNCAFYTSQGLAKAGVLRHSTIWPKVVD